MHNIIKWNFLRVMLAYMHSLTMYTGCLCMRIEIQLPTSRPLELPCTKPDTDEVLWKQNNVVISIGTTVLNSEFGKFELQTRYQNGRTLRINAIKTTDMGNYTCVTVKRRVIESYSVVVRAEATTTLLSTLDTTISTTSRTSTIHTNTNSLLTTLSRFITTFARSSNSTSFAETVHHNSTELTTSKLSNRTGSDAILDVTLSSATIPNSTSGTLTLTTADESESNTNNDANGLTSFLLLPIFISGFVMLSLFSKSA